MVLNASDTALFQKLRPLSARRRKFEAIGWVLVIFAAAMLFAIYLGSDSLLVGILGVVGGIVGGICLYLRHLYVKEKKTLISTHVVQRMLEDNFELLEYNPYRTFTETELHAAELRRWNNHKGNDFFRARYRGVRFSFSDVKLLQNSGRHTSTRLKGQWLILDLHQAIPAPLILSELEGDGLFGGLFDRRTRVPIEQEELNEAFTAITEWPDVIPQVLTPAFQEYLLATRSRFSYPERHLFFGGGQAHFGRSSRRDFFEPCSNVEDIPAVRERVQREIDAIKEILDGFLLIETLFQGADNSLTPVMDNEGERQ